VLGDEDQSVLKSVQEVGSSAYEDKVNYTLRKKEAFLEAQRKMVLVSGVVSDMPYAQPMAVEKMERSLTCLDDLNLAYREDMRKDTGYVELPTDSLCNGGITSICALNDDASVACAMSQGPITVYNWRDGSVVSRFRHRPPSGAPHSAVTKLCIASDDYTYLASGDDQGYVALWDLTEPKLQCDVRLHEEAITGLAWDQEDDWLISTSSDTYILMYDANAEQVVERAAPTGSSRGVPNTLLTQCSEYKKLLLVGGKDGKLRIWSKDDGPLKEQCTLSLGNSIPVRCCVASDGWRAVVGTVPMETDSAYYSKSAVRSGRNQGTTGDLLVFDLRMMHQDMAQTTAMASFAGGAAGLKKSNTSIFSSKSVASRWTRNTLGRGSQAAEPVKEVISAGVADMTLVEENNKCMALCLVDGVVQGYDLDESGTLQASYSFHPAPFDKFGAKQQAIACKDSICFTASSAPSLSVWERTGSIKDEYGHEEYRRPQPRAPLELCAQYVLPEQAAKEKKKQLSDTVSGIEESLRRDRARGRLQELSVKAGKYAVY
jgi:WD40 repeat protein